MSDLLTLPTLAARLGIHLTTVQRRARRGDLGIPVIDLSNDPNPKRRQPRVRVADVETFLKSREIA